jgi:hypothetical protein
MTDKEQLHKLVGDIVNRHDPIALLSGGAPSDEYSHEIGDICIRVTDAKSVDELQTIILSVFTKAFGEQRRRLLEPKEQSEQLLKKYG